MRELFAQQRERFRTGAGNRRPARCDPERKINVYSVRNIRSSHFFGAEAVDVDVPTSHLFFAAIVNGQILSLILHVHVNDELHRFRIGVALPRFTSEPVRDFSCARIGRSDDRPAPLRRGWKRFGRSAFGYESEQRQKRRCNLRPTIRHADTARRIERSGKKMGDDGFEPPTNSM